MDLQELEDLLSDFLPSGFEIKTAKNGEVVIFTNFSIDEDSGDLLPMEDEDEQIEYDEDTEPLEDEDYDDE